MQDYIIFFDGYDGDIRQFENDLKTVRVVDKPVIMSSNSDQRVQPRATQFHELNVAIYTAKNHKKYNVACQQEPSPEAIEQAIMMYRPQPVG